LTTVFKNTLHYVCPDCNNESNLTFYYFKNLWLKETTLDPDKNKLTVKYLIMKKFLQAVLSAILFITVFSISARAGFPIGKGRWMLAPNYSYYTANGYWDAQRVFNSYSDNGRFTSHYFGLYGGYGIDRNWDFIFNIPLVIQTYSNTYQLIQKSSLGDATMGFSYFPTLNDYTKHVAITGSLIIPLYQNINFAPSLSGITPPFVGFESVGGELKIGYSGTNETTLKGVYYDIEAGVREYFSTYGPTQTFFNATIGVPLDEDWKVTGNIATVSSNSNASLATGTTSDGINRDYGYFRLTASIGRKLNKNVQAYLSFFQDVAGRNIGRGHGFSLSTVIKF